MKRTRSYGIFQTIFFATLLTLSACGDGGSSSGGETVDDAASGSSGTHSLFYVGTYTTNSDAEGLYQMRMNNSTGELEMQGFTIDATNPSYVAVHPSGKYLYCVNEVGRDVAPAGWITSFRIDPEIPRPILLNRMSSRGLSPCHLVVDPTGKYLFVANYSDGKVAVLPIAPDGKLLPSSDQKELESSSVTPRQKSSHPHMMCLSPDNRMLYIPDLGGDRIWKFWIDYTDGTLSPSPEPFVEVQAGAGPRHMEFHPNGRFAYVINELDNTVNAYAWNPANGNLDELQRISTLPEGFAETSYCADIHISPDGRFLYGSNRGHNSIVIFEIDGDEGSLELVGHKETRGEWPRNFMITPNGDFLYVANQNSNNIIVFKRNKRTGELTYANQYIVQSPVCLKVR